MTAAVRSADFICPGDIFGLEFADEHTFSAEAIADTKVIVVKRSALTALAGRNATISRELLAITGRELRRVQDHVLLLVKSAQERVASFLLEMAERARAGNIVELPMSRQDIADYLGLTIETVSRTLTGLESAAAIEVPTSRRIVLRNRVGAEPAERLELGAVGGTAMQVRDVMTRNVISVAANETVVNAARIMLQNRISGLPVVDADGELVGIVTEGDFLRRGELGTERRRPKWLEFLLGPGRMAEEYVHASGRKVEDVMTSDPATVAEDDALGTVVQLMECRRIKRLPVLRDGRIVGIVSRANLMHALVSLARDTAAPAGGDAARFAMAFSRPSPSSHGRLGSTSWSRMASRSCGERSPTSASGKAVSSRLKMSPASVRCTIIWSGLSRCPACHFPRRRTKPSCARSRRRMQFIRARARKVENRFSGKDHAPTQNLDRASGIFGTRYLAGDKSSCLR